jgi:tRNA 2-thiouridine synthesizing protein A
MAMLIEVVDTRGLKTPEHILKIAAKGPHMKPGAILEVLGDHPGFEKDVRFWCEETGRRVLSVESEGESTKIIQIQF